MKTKLLLLCAAGLLVALTNAPAATHYVDAASTNAVPPFTNWTTAAAVIQDAVDAAAPGDEIVVTNGVYQTGARAVYGMSNRVAVTKPVTVRSVNGPASTSIVGQGPIGANAIRCVYLTNGAVLAGFTLTNGATQDDGDPEIDSVSNSGGGVWCETRGAVVTSCVLAGNSAFSHGGGTFGNTLNNCTLTGNSAPYGAGAAGSTLNDSTLTNNSAEFGGGAWECALKNCTLMGNRAELAGGGANSSTLTNCTVTGNSGRSDVTAFNHGGGVASSTLENCLVMDNSARDEYAIGGGASYSTLNNCTLRGNFARGGAGAIYSTLNNCLVVENLAGSDGCGGGAAWSTLNNCTLTGNSASYGGGCCSSTLNNCIVYDNTARASGDNYTTGTFNYSCTTPAPASGVGNITNAPVFVDTNGWSNLRLQSNSPCINAGNNAYVTTSTDLDGRPRVVGGTVDIGAYEWQGSIRYVSAASTNPIAPYSSWASAAVTIQDAVDAAVSGDEIVVTNGVYQTGARAVYGMSNRVAVTKPVTVRSVNGPAYTSIVGHGPIGENAIRCAYLTNGAVLAGFTLTNGATPTVGDLETNLSGGGVWCQAFSAVLSNCVLAGNSAFESGGGAYSGTLNNCLLTGNSAYDGGGASRGTLNNCTLTRNSVGDGTGGGAFYSVLNNCVLTDNSGAQGGGAGASTLNNCTLTRNLAEDGGGAIGGTMNNCSLTGNTAYDGGGAYSSTLNNCTLTGNASESIGGGAWSSTLTNCLLTGNSAGDWGGGVASSTLNNCTLVGNSADSPWSDQTKGGGAYASTLNNCIVYYNRADYYDNHYGSTLNYSCTPDAGSGVGNITAAPTFVDFAGGNLRLQSNSPCINAGNNAYVTAATDLDGLPRIAGGTVDIGAYEFQSPASTISYAWLQQFGLPTDGSADDADTDHDGHNNWQEWMAGTDPTNALSVLWLASPVITPTHVTLTWTSITNRTYTLEQATNLGAAPAFSVLRSNLTGLPGTTSWTDTNAPVSSPRFYQLRVSP